MTESADYKDTFDLIDADDDGQITAVELQRLMKALGSDVSLATAEAGVKKFDGDGDGKLSYEEFVVFMDSGL